MRALILAGGRGKRLRPVTDYVPKPLVPVANVPIIEWQLRYLARHGIRQATVCAGRMADQIEDRLSRISSGVDVSVSVEGSPLGTGGAIRRAAGSSREPVLVMNGDVITDLDVGRMLGVPDSIAVVPLRTRFGLVELDGDAVSGFDEKGAVPGSWMSAGIYHLSSRAVRDLPARGDIERTLFPGYAGRGMLSAVRFGGAMWHSIDSFKDVEECAASLSTRRSGAA